MARKNRIRELRKERSLSQEAFAQIFGVTQQSISRMESGAYDIPTDILIRMAEQFNITTDYILGLSDVKRSPDMQVRLNRKLDQYHDILLRLENLPPLRKETLLKTMQTLLTCLEESSEYKTNGGGKEQ